MIEIVNLRRVRKRLAREKDARQADENRILYGRSKTERLQTTMEKIRLKKSLDGAQLGEAQIESSSSDGTLPDYKGDSSQA